MGIEYRHYLIPQPNEFRPTPEQLRILIDQLRSGGWICNPDAPYFRKMTFKTYSYFPHARRSGAYFQVAVAHAKPRSRARGLQVFRREFQPLPYPLSIEELATLLTRDLIIGWPVENLAASGLNYPFEENRWPADETYYKLEMQVAEDYIDTHSEQINPSGGKVICECSASLEYHNDDDIFYAGRIHSSCPKCGKRVDVSARLVGIRDAWTGKEWNVAGGATHRFAIVIDCGKSVPSENDEPTLKYELIELCEQTLGCQFVEIGTLS
jgi:hypothetical protein